MFSLNRNTRNRALGMGIAVAVLAAASQAHACCVSHAHRGGGGMGWGHAGAGLAAGIGFALIANAVANQPPAAAAPPPGAGPAPGVPPRVTGTAYMKDVQSGRSLAKVYLDNGTELVSRDGARPQVQRTNRPPKYAGQYRKLPDGGRIDRFIDRNTGQEYLRMTSASGQHVAVGGSMNGIPFR